MKTSFLKATFISVILFLPGLIFAQEKLELNECRKMARENYPKLKQTDLFEKIEELKVKNNGSAYLPQIELKGQATYQSDVTSLDLSIPGITIPSLPKDQYKVYLDMKQTIWDGGLSKSKNELENASLKSDLQKLEVEAYQLNGMVDAYFFNLLIIQQNEKVLSAQADVLDKQITRLDDACKQGAARQKDLEKLQAERILLKQKSIELTSRRESVKAVLSVITGKSIASDVQLQLPGDQMDDVNTIQRPEFKLFDLQQKQLLASDQLITSSRKPMFYGFGQAGYGRPGLNMLSSKFKPYYLVGLGVSWRVLDWHNSTRSKKINDYQRDIIGTMQSDFEQKQQMQLADAKAQISGLKQLIDTDEGLVELRKKISEQAESELNNGVITSTDYLSDLNSETVAQLNFETHKIQLVQAIVNYNNILGK